MTSHDHYSYTIPVIESQHIVIQIVRSLNCSLAVVPTVICSDIVTNKHVVFNLDNLLWHLLLLHAFMILAIDWFTLNSWSY